MASRKDANPATEGLPFGAMDRSDSNGGAAVDEGAKKPARKKATRRKTKAKTTRASSKDDTAEAAPDDEAKPRKRRTTKKATASASASASKSKAKAKAEVEVAEPADSSDRAPAEVAEPARSEDPGGERPTRERETGDEAPARGSDQGSENRGERTDGEDGQRRRPKRRRGRRGRRGGRGREGQDREGGGGPRPGGQGDGQRKQQGQDQNKDAGGAPVSREVEGMLVLEKANHGRLRQLDRGLMPHKHDVHVPPRLVQSFQLRDGAMIQGVYGKGQGKNKWDLKEIKTIDGRDPKEARSLPTFKNLTSIDPDFHYAVGDGSEETSLKIVDLLCPVGRGQRGLIVAPPRSGKTILLQQFAKAIEKIYPEVHLVVLLVDERPEEATEWKRTVENGHVFVSTNDEMHKTHVELCESVWRFVRRKVELGEDVILLMDSITRIGRAYNNVHGNSGKTMSGGLDTRALERPKQLFGSARNTETAGSLTILATALIETGSMMDKVIFEEFKGTGNMELVLSRKLSDRRIFPAIDIEKSGTRKEEKLLSSVRHKRITTLRRVLARMHFAEAMELLITKLDDVVKIDDFLKRFDIDPEA